MQVMTKVQVRKLAKERFGPNADCVTNHNPLDRSQRFGVVTIIPKGIAEGPVLACVGYGDSWKAAWDMCLTGPNGILLAEQWAQTLEDYKKFKDDPTGYFKDRKEEIEKLNQIQETASNELLSSI